MHILNLFEQIHAAGFVYNDLKLDNLMTDYKCKLPKDSMEQNVFVETTLNVVDFGFATKYLHEEIDEQGNKQVIHKPKRNVNFFRGNMVFSSVNQLEFMTTSRRDDLISLCYLLVFLINEGNIPDIDIY